MRIGLRKGGGRKWKKMREGLTGQFSRTVFSRTGNQLSDTAPALGAGGKRKTMF